MANQDNFYEINGVKYPRVTHVLKSLSKPGLDRWRGRLGNFEADKVAFEGSTIGNEFHAIVADINRGIHRRRGWVPEAKYREMAYAYIELLHSEIESIQEVEFTVHSMEQGYAGTLDLLATFRGDDRPSIIDLKTSNSVSLDWPLQLSAYSRAYEEMTGISPLKRAVIRIPKKGECVPELYVYENNVEDDAAWLNILSYWRWLQKDKERQKLALKKK